MIYYFKDALTGFARYSKPAASSANIVRYHIMLKTSEWYKNLYRPQGRSYGNAWFSLFEAVGFKRVRSTLSRNDAEYRLNLLRKKGLV